MEVTHRISDNSTMSEQSEIAKRLEHFMDASGISTTALAAKAGLNPSFVRDVLNGRSKSPRGDNIQKLANVLEINVQDLLGGTQVQLRKPGREIGFCESSDAAEFIPKPETPGANAKGPAALAAALCPSARHPAYWRVKNNLPGFGIFADDLLIVDLKPDSTGNELVLVNSREEQGGARTLLRRHIQPYLIAPDPVGTQIPLLHDGDQNAIMGVVMAVVRAPELAEG